MKNPLVFLNACETARGPGHIPTALFRAFAGSVVGTIWPVFDDQASVFGRLYLTLILGGRSQGAALRAAKAYAILYANKLSVPDSLSWHSYILYGDPTNVPYLSAFLKPEDLEPLLDNILGK
jgi:CHAT domain-containing protein